MQCYSELLPPSGVTHSVQAAFLAGDASNLIVAKTSLLQIFNFSRTEGSDDACLNLVAEYPLQGTITALVKLTLLKSKSGGDALLIAFRDAKLSLVEWDPGQHSISTISIHYYENRDQLLCPWSPNMSDCPSHLTVDPSSRCAAFNFSDHSLAIIPFHQDTDDLAMDNDLDDSDSEDRQKSPTKQTNGDSAQQDRLYVPSFVLPMTALDPGLLHPVACTFLHEYREPTIGILFSTQAASHNMAPDRRDMLVYAVYTLDVEQKASTTLLSVARLPNDLSQVIALPAPIGGALLVGGNEVLHVDQGGRSTGVGINEFSKQCTSFAMADQSDLELRLEGCQVQNLYNASNEVLLILNDGRFAVITIRLDGRSVSGLTIRIVDPTLTQSIFNARSSCVTSIGDNHMFIGSEEADSVLICAARKVPQLKKQLSRAQVNNGDMDADFDDDIDEDEDDDDDDLYAESKTNGAAQHGAFDGNGVSLNDRLHSLAPLQDVVLGRPPKRKREDESELEDAPSDLDRLDLLASCNKGANGCLAFLSRSLKPKVVKTYKRANATSIWALSSEPSELDIDARPFDDMIVIAEGPDTSSRQSSLLVLSTTIEEKDANDFEKNDRAIATGRLVTGSHVVVYTRDVRAYNTEFGLDQIFAIVDEDADATAEVVAATVTDTHILILKDDHTISLLKADKSGDLDEVDLPEIVPNEDILSACLFNDYHDFFGTKRFARNSAATGSLVLAVLTKAGVISLHPVSNLGVQVFHYSNLDFLPTYLSHDAPVPKHWRAKDTLAEMTLCNLGTQSHGKPYLIVRNSTSDITIYEPYHVPDIQGAYRFVKLCCHNADAREPSDEKDIDDSDDDVEVRRSSKLVPLHDVGGVPTVIVTGKYPSIITKPRTSMPRVHKLDTGPILHVSGFHDSSCNRGLVYVDAAGRLTFCEIPTDIILDFADWTVEKVEINEDVTNITYHPRTGSYVVATSSPAPFQLPRDDEWHPEWAGENEQASPKFLPTTSSFSLKLISSKTHSIISQYHFTPDEHVLAVKCMSLEVSEQTHERKDLIVVGTGIARGENVVARGNLYLFDIVDVVPHPEIPETDLKLKMITKEDVRGAVTAISDIGTQGFLLAAQGQKCMVRGLREDNAILPVAFMDMRYYVSVAKSLPGTGLTILADAFSGLWLMGYSEEPYKMQLLGRDLENPSVVAAEFMPQEKQLYIISSDGNGDLRVLQYDPWNPKTERGSILLHKSTFNTGYFPTVMALLPRSPTPSEALVASNSAAANRDSDSEDGMEVEVPPLPITHQILMVTKEGAIALVTPLSEQSYRRLSTLQTSLMAQLDQPCSLNPRAYRQVETDGVGGRAMIDGEMVRRWLYQSSQHKYNHADRVGGTVWDLRADMEGISGAGFGYL